MAISFSLPQEFRSHLNAAGETVPWGTGAGKQRQYFSLFGFGFSKKQEKRFPLLVRIRERP
jgi:hypothetical protein